MTSTTQPYVSGKAIWRWETIKSIGVAMGVALWRAVASRRLLRKRMWASSARRRSSCASYVWLQRIRCRKVVNVVVVGRILTNICRIPELTKLEYYCARFRVDWKHFIVDWNAFVGPKCAAIRAWWLQLIFSCCWRCWRAPWVMWRHSGYCFRRRLEAWVSGRSVSSRPAPAY